MGALRAFMAAGIAKSWRDPVILNPQPLWFLPDQNDYENNSVLTEPFKGFGSEDPFFYFDKQKQKWRALFHEMRRPGRIDPPGALVPNGPVDKWCGGYAESVTADLWGKWEVRSPQYGAYSKDIDFAPHGTTSKRDPTVSFPAGLLGSPSAPYKLGRSYAAYMNESLTSWGGNVIEDDDGLYHLYTSAMSENIHRSNKPCAIGSWTTNSLVIHAVATSPIGPFKMVDVALPTQHTNPHITRAADGEYLLYSIGGINCSHAGQAGCGVCGYGVCRGCHKGHCGPVQCSAPSPFPPLGPGNVTLSRRERPKLLLDKTGKPTHLYNSADPGPALGPHPNRGWTDRPFTLVTEILESIEAVHV